MTIRINESKTLTKYVIVHPNLMVEFVIQVKSGKTINENVTVKNSIKDRVCMYAKKIMPGILVHVFVRLIMLI